MPRDNNRIERSQYVTRQLQSHLQQYGYELQELALIQPSELFLTKAGDQIVQSLFKFERHNRELALRPEFTAGAAYHYSLTHSNQVVRWQFNGYIFQENPASNVADYQQWSIGAELIGMSHVVADAEIIAIAALGLEDLGLEKWKLVVGHTGLTRSLLRQFNLDVRVERFLMQQMAGEHHSIIEKEKILQHYNTWIANSNLSGDQPWAGNSSDKPMGGRTQEDIARRLQQKRRRTHEWDRFVAALDFLNDWMAIRADERIAFDQMRTCIAQHLDGYQSEILMHWKKSLSLLDQLGVESHHITIQPAIARAWEYYTGVVFELYIEDLHVGGGGRYDELIRMLGSGRDVPAVGFTYYADHITDHVKIPDENFQSVYNFVTPDHLVEQALPWVKHIRLSGIRVQMLLEAVDSPYSLFLEDRNEVRVKDSVYRFDQIELLISDLKQGIPQ